MDAASDAVAAAQETAKEADEFAIGNAKQAKTGYTLENLVYGINQIYSADDDNVININLGQASSNCSGANCTTDTQIGQTVQNQANMVVVQERDAAQPENSGGETILNFNRANDLWVKNGKGVMQCVGFGCRSVVSNSNSYVAKTLPKKSLKQAASPKIRILFENIQLGQGNIINIGESSGASINVGDGGAQCIGNSCSSNSTKSWKSADVSEDASQDASQDNSPSVQTVVPCGGSLCDVPSSRLSKEIKQFTQYGIILSNLTLSQGNIINIGESNTLSINIGDGASQCIGVECSSIASKVSSYSSKSSKASTVTRSFNGVIEGAANYPFTLVFKNVSWGNANIINVGSFNRNGVVTGDNLSQCIGEKCISSVTASTEITNNATVEQSRVSREESGRKLQIDEPISLSNLYMGQANVVNFGRGNTLSINIGDGASQCVGDKCSSKSVRTGDIDALPKDPNAPAGDGDPKKPSKVEEEAVTANSVSLTWKDADAAPPDAKYSVNCVEGSDTKCEDEGKKVKDLDPKVETATVDGLSSGTEYECWVKLSSTILNENCAEEPLKITTA